MCFVLVKEGTVSIASALSVGGDRSMASECDCRREGALLNHVQTTAKHGDAQSVLDAIDNYSQLNWFMHIGNVKGLILDAAVVKFEPSLALELGTYCGYSAIRISSRFTNPNVKLFSLEISPARAAIARRMIHHAGLSSRVEVIEGSLSESLDKLENILKEKEKGSPPFFDLVFLDHAKQFYLTDFLLLKERKLIGKGSGIVADNMINPGAPDFLNYLRTHPHELETQEFPSHVEYMPSIPDMVTVSTLLA